MVSVRRAVVFQVAPDSGPGFSAHAVGHSIFIQGDTIAVLRQNADDAILRHFGETGPPPQIGFQSDNDESRAG